MEMSKIVAVIGQMNVDLIYKDINRFPNEGEEVFATDFKIELGGGPMVIPIMLSRLGIPVKLGTYFGDDFQSRIASDLLNDIRFHYVETLKTRKKHPVVVTCVITTEAERSFVCYNEGADELDCGPESIYEFYKSSSICFCPQDLSVARKLKDEGKILVFDVGWTDDLSFQKIGEHLRVCDYFTPNEKEAEKLTGTHDPLVMLDRLEAYTKTPIVNLGRRGCIVKLDSKYIHVPGLKFNTIDPTGAGDNFLTGLIYGLYHELPLVDCIRYGNIMGGLCTEVLGCFRWDLNPQMIEAYWNQCPEAQEITHFEL